ncbi:CHASE3 domain-containing protein [Streptomyces sp. NPDC056909]|uniref:sensor histidine kinase n=1 Tax=Streptomyces sp. NPDC056909 TaxID=3345963 RepID=UPI00368397A1
MVSETPRPPTARHATAARLSVQGWVQLILGALVLVVCGCTVAGGVLLSRTNDRTNELVDHIQPARSTVFQFQKSLLDQETGVRGFALTADDSFLTPYARGREDERRLAARVGAIVASNAQFTTDLDRITRAARTWRSEEAEPLIASVRTGAPEAASAARMEDSKESFDELRHLFAVQQEHLDTARDRARAELNDARSLRDTVLIMILVVFVLAVAGLALLLRQMVGRPLNALRAASDGVRAGAFDRRIEVGGPADLRAVAAAVEDMRGRLADEIAAGRSREAVLAAQTEELRRSNSELEQFAYVASHDLQEPLRKIASFCQLLEKRYGTVLDERGKQYIDFAVDGAKRMQTLINDLLAFSRVGRVHDTRQTVRLDKVLDRALGNLGLVIQEAGATVVREDPLPEVNGDPTTLTMLWQNLIGNAVKFRRPDVPCRIAVGCSRQGDEWRLSVVDNGIGVAPEFAEKVFVIFQRLHGRDEYEGTGIGLAVSRKIVEFHGGRIRLEPGPEGGTSIVFTLPVAVGGPEAPEAARPSAAAQLSGAARPLEAAQPSGAAQPPPASETPEPPRTPRTPAPPGDLAPYAAGGTGEGDVPSTTPPGAHS